MFTGIIETTARVVNIEKENTNYHFTLEVPFGDELPSTRAWPTTAAASRW